LFWFLWFLSLGFAGVRLCASGLTRLGFSCLGFARFRFARSWFSCLGFCAPRFMGTRLRLRFAANRLVSARLCTLSTTRL